MRERSPSSGAQAPPGRGPGSSNGRPARRRAMPSENRFAIAAGALALIAGIAVLAAAGSGTAATIAAAMLFGIAGIAFVSLIFLIVGQSEETDRQRHPRG